MSTEAAREAVDRRVPQWEWADRVRRVRRDMRMSQDAFAAFLGIGAKRLGAWESGASEPANAVEMARLIEAKTGVPAVWMLGLDATGLRSATVPTLTSHNRQGYSRSAMRTPMSRVVRHPVSAL
jgi:transcriptional regulator with XRE-family HTH domain